jgi:hypothetical protein
MSDTGVNKTRFDINIEESEAAQRRRKEEEEFECERQKKLKHHCLTSSLFVT